MREIKIGWILDKFLFAFLWTATKWWKSTKTQKRKNAKKKKKKKKKERGQYPTILTEQARTKDVLQAQKITLENFAFSGTKRAIPSGQDRPIVPARVANQNTGTASPCPLAEPAIY